jgi:hypothetical protein
MAEFPGADLFTRGLDDAVFRFAEVVEGALGEVVEGEREAGEAIDENAVVDVAAGGVVAGDGGGALPGFAAAAGVPRRCAGADRTGSGEGMGSGGWSCWRALTSLNGARGMGRQERGRCG